MYDINELKKIIKKTTLIRYGWVGEYTKRIHYSVDIIEDEIDRKALLERINANDYYDNDYYDLTIGISFYRCPKSFRHKNIKLLGHLTERGLKVYE